MTKYVTKPFWSYDIEKTEQWLAKMAQEGYLFTSIQPILRKFSFHKGKPKQQTYKIVHAKNLKESFPDTLKEAGWSHIDRYRHWHFLMHPHSQEKINIFPDREGVIAHNQKRHSLFSGLLIYLFVVIFFNTLFVTLDFFSSGDIEIVPSPLWALTFIGGGLAIGLFILAIYTVIKLPKANQKLLGSVTSIQEKGKIIHEKKLIKRRKWYGYDAPDRLETWLEEMGRQGYHLVRVSRGGGMFYFEKGKPRKKKYIVDFQWRMQKSYFSMHKELGWTLHFQRGHSFFHWAIWSQPYEKGEQSPQMYTESVHVKRNAWKILFANLLFTVPLLTFIAFIFFQNNFFYGEKDILHVFLFSIYLFGITMLLFRLLRAIGYFYRVRKHFTTSS